MALKKSNATKSNSAKKLGESIGINFKKYSLAEFKKGLKVEQEHKDVTKGDPIKTAKIAFAHMKESPEYYKKLTTMEKSFKKRKSSS
jgi:hypothetical protein